MCALLASPFVTLHVLVQFLVLVVSLQPVLPIEWETANAQAPGTLVCFFRERAGSEDAFIVLLHLVDAFLLPLTQLSVS